MKNCHKISITMQSLRVMMLSACAPLWAVSDGLAQVAQSVPPVAGISGDTFTNPLLQNGPDPWVIWWKGFYYYSDSSGQNLTLRKTADTHSLVPIRVPMPLAQDTTASSSLPTVRKTGLSITPIRSPETAATIFAHRVSSASLGIPTARRTSVRRCLWVSSWRNRTLNASTKETTSNP